MGKSDVLDASVTSGFFGHPRQLPLTVNYRTMACKKICIYSRNDKSPFGILIMGLLSCLVLIICDKAVKLLPRQNLLGSFPARNVRLKRYQIPISSLGNVLSPIEKYLKYEVIFSSLLPIARTKC